MYTPTTTPVDDLDFIDPGKLVKVAGSGKILFEIDRDGDGEDQAILLVDVPYNGWYPYYENLKLISTKGRDPFGCMSHFRLGDNTKWNPDDESMPVKEEHVCSILGMPDDANIYVYFHKDRCKENNKAYLVCKDGNGGWVFLRPWNVIVSCW